MNKGLRRVFSILFLSGGFDMVSIFIRTFLIYILLSITLKTMGKRQLGELDVSELVSTLLISEIAALPIDDPDLPLMNAIIPIIFILSLEIILSYSKTKFNRLKKYVEGEPVFIIYKGKLKQQSLKDNRISINEFLAEMRNQGIGDIKQIEYALLEQNGKISILKREDDVSHPIIIDGEINTAETTILNMDESEIASLFKTNKAKQERVFLMTINDKNDINIILKEKT